VLDAHGHLFHPNWYPRAFALQLESSLGANASESARSALLRAMSDESGAATLRSMDLAGIDRRILLILDWGLELGEPALSIRDIHEAILGVCRQYPQRFCCFAGVDPRRPDAAELLGWAFDEQHAGGLKLHPTSPAWTLEDERTRRLVALTAERQLPVLVHVGETFPGLVDRNATPESFVSLARAFPETLFIGGHAGFRLWPRFSSLGLPPNALLDISGWQSLDDGTDSFADELLSFIAAFPEQVVFGTDSPFFGLPAAGADARWVKRVTEIVADAPSASRTSLFDHPRLQAATSAASA
jgi:uncharacterized protein